MSDSASGQPLRIAYLPFYVDYYESICPDFPREKAEIARRCAEALAPFGQVLWDGRLLSSVETAAERAAQLHPLRPDVAVVVPTIAVFGGIAWAALRELDVPVLIWNAQQIRTVGAGYSMLAIVRNTGQIGAQALANTLMREGRWFRVVSGYESSERTALALGRFFRIVGAATAMRSARLLMAGEGFPLMTDVELDAEYLSRHLGPSVCHASRQELTDAFVNADVPRSAVEVDACRRNHSLAELTPDELQRSVRLSQALDALVVKHDAHAGSLNCHGGNCLRNEQIGITACYALGVQNAAGRPFTCTGDLPTALAMLLLKRLAGASMYTEVQVMDEVREAIVIANSGEGEEGIRHPDAPARLVANTNFAGIHGRGASFAYALRPGPATLLSLTPTPSGPKPFRLIAAEGEILPEPLPDAGALAGFFRFAHASLHVGYVRWLEAGPVHHAGTAPGHWANEITEVADLLRFELIRI
jgi:L-fucose isomerase-like protein